MSCDPKTFPGVTREVFNCLNERLSGIGYELEGTEGTINGPMGIVIDYRWDEAESSLYTHVKSKNFLVPCGRINSELEKAIEGCIG